MGGRGRAGASGPARLACAHTTHIQIFAKSFRAAMSDECVYIDSRVMSASFKNNASFVSRLPTIRRHKSTSLHSPAPHSKPAAHRYDVNASAENLGKPRPLARCAPQFAHIIHSHFHVLVCNCRNYVLYSFCFVSYDICIYLLLLKTKRD